MKRGQNLVIKYKIFLYSNSKDGVKSKFKKMRMKISKTMSIDLQLILNSKSFLKMEL